MKMENMALALVVATMVGMVFAIFDAERRECRFIEIEVIHAGKDSRWGCVSGAQTTYRSEAGVGKTCLQLGEPGSVVTYRRCEHPSFWRDFDKAKADE